tara:strand:- start:3371 stop:4495 length:1125 start_codon:yes stop_codon:yes gene_type:complete
MNNKKILITFVMGTRPEIIKLAPLITLFKKNKLLIVRVVLTGQHLEMAEDILNLFEIKEDLNLKIMKSKQSLTYITSAVINGLKEEFMEFCPELVFIQGDTSTAFAAALAAFLDKIPIAHIEAGLRTLDLMNPFPEEANRRLISQISSLHFAPTKKAFLNLKKFGIKENCFITGNTVIDSIKLIQSRNYTKSQIFSNKFKENKLILVTIHRRENWGQRLDSILDALSLIVKRHKNITLLLPMHKNQILRSKIEKKLGNNPQILLTEPLLYSEFIEVLTSCYFILTDSGGIQEEAPSLGKPVLILRESTERKEAIDCGAAILVNNDRVKILEVVNKLLNDSQYYKSMQVEKNPFGDGNACNKIMKHTLNFLSIKD